MPYLLEAVTLAQEGVALQRIDKAAKDYGMPMGPIELADTVGLDICQSVAEILAGELGLEVPPMLGKLLDQGRLGKKSGHGFYRYDKNGKALRHRTETEPTISATQIQQRLILRLFNECSACLADGIVADSELLDAGMVFGTGFAPFRGGPVHAMETKGITDCTDQLKQFSHQYGERFLPHPGWRVLS
jgi:3-hydroxyacyl-CoA dehydrogenase/enoyl-CoA hydratase/3-hydroxybutyryl-CoA epimerase